MFQAHLLWQAPLRARRGLEDAPVMLLFSLPPAAESFLLEEGIKVASPSDVGSEGAGAPGGPWPGHPGCLLMCKRTGGGESSRENKACPVKGHVLCAV